MWGMPSPFRWRTPHSTHSQVNYCLSFLGGAIAMAEHNLKSIAFPTLDEVQISELGRCTTGGGVVHPLQTRKGSLNAIHYCRQGKLQRHPALLQGLGQGTARSLQ